MRFIVCYASNLARCMQVFSIHPLTTEDIQMEETREKIELFRTYYLVCFRSFDQDPYSPTHLEPVNMYIIVFREGILSVRPCASFVHGGIAYQPPCSSISAQHRIHRTFAAESNSFATTSLSHLTGYRTRSSTTLRTRSVRLFRASSMRSIASTNWYLS